MSHMLHLTIRVLVTAAIAGLLALPLPAAAQPTPTTANVLMYTTLCPHGHDSAGECDYYRTAILTATGVDVSYTSTAGWGTGVVDNATVFSNLGLGTYEFVLYKEPRIRKNQEVHCRYQGSSTDLIAGVVRNRVVLTLDHPGDVDCAWLVESTH